MYALPVATLPGSRLWFLQFLALTEARRITRPYPVIIKIDGPWLRWSEITYSKPFALYHVPSFPHLRFTGSCRPKQHENGVERVVQWRLHAWPRSSRICTCQSRVNIPSYVYPQASEIQECLPVWRLSLLKATLEEDASPVMRKVFAVLFPFGPAWNSILGTFYISS